MTKAEIIKEISSRTGLQKSEISTVVEALLSIMKNSLVKRENIYLRGFGTFLVKHRREKLARNINRNETITVPAHDIPAFKPSPSFAAAMANSK